MSDDRCIVVPAGERYTGAQGLDYVRGLTRQTAGTRRVCMVIVHAAADDQEGIVLLPELDTLVP